MKRSYILLGFAFTSIFTLGCGPSAEETEKQKEEIIKIESATVEVDSSLKEIKKSSEELDDLLNQLNAQ
jgi:hypothetical protein